MEHNQDTAPRFQTDELLESSAILTRFLPVPVRSGSHSPVPLRLLRRSRFVRHQLQRRLASPGCRDRLGHRHAIGENVDIRGWTTGISASACVRARNRGMAGIADVADADGRATSSSAMRSATRRCGARQGHSGRAHASHPACRATAIARTLVWSWRSTRDKARLRQPGSSFRRLRRQSLRRGNLAELALERLVDFLGEIGIELAELGRLRRRSSRRSS